MSRHTPGPWKTAHDIPGLGGVVASLGTTLNEKSHFILATEVVTDEMVPANARLIAQAPAMYSLLGEAYSYLITIQPQLAGEIDVVLSSVDEASAD